MPRSAAEGDWPEQDIQRIILAAARVGQHVFALNVLNNCGRQCVFCGLNPAPFGARKMLLAGHIKPWKDIGHRTLDLRKGLAACPSHDVAFFRNANRDCGPEDPYRAAAGRRGLRGQLTRQYYGRLPLLNTLLLPDDAERPRQK